MLAVRNVVGTRTARFATPCTYSSCRRSKQSVTVSRSNAHVWLFTSLLRSIIPLSSSTSHQLTRRPAQQQRLHCGDAFISPPPHRLPFYIHTALFTPLYIYIYIKYCSYINNCNVITINSSVLIFYYLLIRICRVRAIRISYSRGSAWRQQVLK